MQLNRVYTRPREDIRQHNNSKPKREVTSGKY